MFELYIIRHGLAGKPLEDKTEDAARPLKKKGKDEMKEIAKGLKELKISFDNILTSPLARAKESAEIVNGYCGNSKDVTITKLLQPGASYAPLIKFLNALINTQKIAIVGHEPFLSGFASYCLSKSDRAFLNLKKGGVLKLEGDEQIEPGRCLLSWLMEPRQMIQQFKKKNG